LFDHVRRRASGEAGARQSAAGTRCRRSWRRGRHGCSGGRRLREEVAGKAGEAAAGGGGGARAGRARFAPRPGGLPAAGPRRALARRVVRCVLVGRPRATQRRERPELRARYGVDIAAHAPPRALRADLPVRGGARRRGRRRGAHRVGVQHDGGGRPRVRGGGESGGLVRLRRVAGEAAREEERGGEGEQSEDGCRGGGRDDDGGLGCPTSTSGARGRARARGGGVCGDGVRRRGSGEQRWPAVVDRRYRRGRVGGEARCRGRRGGRRRRPFDGEERLVQRTPGIAPGGGRVDEEDDDECGGEQV
jgi:hypothetical protein